jgi:methylamine dehydrogenase heavy chain
MSVPTVSAASLCLALALTGSAAAVPPPLPAEHLEVAHLPPMNPHWVFIVDEALFNEVDARIFVYDGDHHRHLGQIDAGYYPGFAMSPDRKTTAVSATYWSRGWHGTRTDVVEFTDNATLAFQGEVVLPAKRMQGPPTPFNLGYSPDQRFVYASNLSPAASFTVVDVAKHEVAAEIDTDGCVLVIPTGPRHVSSLCENGRILTVTLGEDGREAARSLSTPFFNADRDPIFVQGIPTAHDVLFLSFLGDVYPVTFAAGTPRFGATWPLVTPAERGKWRPGGNQMGAISRTLARLYVPMHVGGEGSHKQGGTEIWVFDTDSHQRVARWPVDHKRFGAVLTAQVTNDAEPLLFATTENATLLVFDARSGQLKHAEPKVGQTPWYLWTP